MATRTILKKVDIQSFVPLERLDKTFNHNGLCAYCGGRYSCALSAEEGLIYDCDDYRAAEDEVAPLVFSTIGMGPVPEDEEAVSGLCASCQIRDLCPLKYIRGGVWHCEEYQ